MIEQTVEVNTPVTVTVKSLSGVPGDTLPPPEMVLLKDGVVQTSVPITVTDVGAHGLYNFRFTPSATGYFVLYVYGEIQAQINVQSRSVFSYLKNIEDESLGSWLWDKTAGTLKMLRQDGTEMATFAVVDDMTKASRERVL